MAGHDALAAVRRGPLTKLGRSNDWLGVTLYQWHDIDLKHRGEHRPNRDRKVQSSQFPTSEFLVPGPLEFTSGRRLGCVALGRKAKNPTSPSNIKMPAAMRPSVRTHPGTEEPSSDASQGAKKQAAPRIQSPFVTLSKVLAALVMCPYPGVAVPSSD